MRKRALRKKAALPLPMLAEFRIVVAYSTGIPKELRPSVERCINRWKRLLPTWCHTLTVSYEPHLTDNVLARVCPRPQYRDASLEISGAWAQRDEHDRDDALLHEFIHVAIGPLQRCFEHLLEELTDKNSPVGKTLEGIFIDALEATTQDLTRALHGWNGAR